MAKRISEQTKKGVVYAWRDGWRIWEIEERFKISVSSIYRILHAEGEVPLDRRKK